MTTPKNTMQQDTELEETAQQAAKEEEAAKAAPRLTVYTHKFEEPFSWNGRIYKELTFNFAGLIGQDCMSALRIGGSRSAGAGGWRSWQPLPSGSGPGTAGCRS